MIETIPSCWEDILDISGPNTLDGGYSSPSQVISSTMLSDVVETEGKDGEAVNATLFVFTIGVVKAEAAAITMATRRKVNLDMMDR